MQVLLIGSALTTTYETVTWVNQATGPTIWLYTKLGFNAIFTVINPDEILADALNGLLEDLGMGGCMQSITMFVPYVPVRVKPCWTLPVCTGKKPKCKQGLHRNPKNPPRLTMEKCTQTLPPSQQSHP